MDRFVSTSPMQSPYLSHVKKIVFIYVKVPINMKVSLIWSRIHTKVQLYNLFFVNEV
jgi:hypothetical protein